MLEVNTRMLELSAPMLEVIERLLAVEWAWFRRGNEAE